jgi:hypothetical protein
VTLNSGVYSADIPSVTGISKMTLQLIATDNSNNSLSYTFELPVGTAPPAPSITPTPDPTTNPTPIPPTSTPMPPSPTPTPPDTTSPVTSITSPTNGSSVKGTITVTATATDNVAVTKVELYKNGVLYGTDTTSPYSFSWNTLNDPNGQVTLNTQAYDQAGNSGTSTNVVVNVNNPDITPPSTSIISPLNGAVVSNIVTIQAQASDNIRVTRVEIYIDSLLKSTLTSSPYVTSWDTTKEVNGTHTIFSKAYDAAGNTGTSSIITVTTNNSSGGGDTQLPIVTITSPANGTSILKNSTITIYATASDNIGVTKVEFLINNVLKCTDPSPSYSCSWKVPAKKNAAYTITSKAYDAALNVGSNTVKVTAK